MKKAILICAVALAASAQTVTRDFVAKIVEAADDRPNHPARYDPSYVRIPYPNGDVPADTGVCTDEIIRIYRAAGIDLQKKVHDDIAAHPSAYPTHGTLDTNIDHRRVSNLTVFFARNGERLPVSDREADYLPGDIVTWKLPRGYDHIGMVTDRKLRSGRYMVEHNIGEGPRIEDVLFAWKITGHFRYRPVK
ncbi:MAG: DUF1287 domain-containing protein [Terriglobales bacterium]